MQTNNPAITKIKETCLYVSDLEQTRTFYEGKLGLKCFALQEGKFAFFKAGTSVLLCFIADYTKDQTSLPQHHGTGHLHFAFECNMDDYEPWKEKITASGITIEHEHHWPNGGKSFYFRDPDEHSCEIVQPNIWDYADE